MKHLILTIIMVLVVLISFETVAQARYSAVLPQKQYKEAMRRARIYGGYNYSPEVLPQKQWKEAMRRARIYGGYDYSPVVLPRRIGRNDFSLQICVTRDFISIGGGGFIIGSR